jgi:hypothetical protein
MGLILMVVVLEHLVVVRLVVMVVLVALQTVWETAQIFTLHHKGLMHRQHFLVVQEQEARTDRM